MIYVVIDTNVLVSALITKNPEAATAKVEKAGEFIENGTTKAVFKKTGRAMR